MKKLEIKTPLIHLVSIILFFIVVSFIIERETQGKSELYKFIYSLSFSMTNDIYGIILGTLLFIPIPFLVYSIYKKRKDLITGFLVSTLTSIVLITIVTFS